MADSQSMSENRAVLSEQVYSLQNQNAMITKQIGKLLRQFNQNKPIRLHLNGILTKQSLDFILAGLKNTEIVSELNLSDN